MATITQIAPTSDSIKDATGFYVNQINVTGVVTPPVNYVTTVSSPALYVAASGAVSSTGTLATGTYTASGTVSDSGGNNGTWVFTLTVLGIPTAQVTVVPQIPTPPTGVEIAVPFQIDPATGAVAVLVEYEEIVEQHIISIVLTQKTERVMLPNYGSPLQAAVFQAITTSNNALLAKDIQSAITAWEPAVNIARVKISNSPQSLTQLDIGVSYSINPHTEVNTVTVTTGGTISQVDAI